MIESKEDGASPREHFGAELLKVRAIERVIELIGESASALSSETQATIVSVDCAGLIGLRVMLAHNYQRIKKSQLWVAATVDVPL